MLTRLRFSTLFVAATFVLGALVACSSSDTPAPSSEEGFCDSLASAYTKCGGATSCGTAMSADCTKLAGLLSPSVLDGARSCVQSTACGGDPLSCLGKALGDAKPSAAQTKLATDYCESCSVVGGEACTTAFFGTSKVPGLGFALLPFGDAPLAAIDSSCTKNPLGKAACQAAFTTCLTTTTTKSLATTVSADSAKCLVDGIKNGLAGVGRDAGPGADGAAPDGCDGCAGCCQDGVCQTGDEPSACGGGGAACESCQGSATCTDGKCSTTCGPDNCAGCCAADGTCSTAGSNAACGSGGAACTACAGSRTCDGGQCIDPSCKASCASGCCTASGCQGGTTTAACGSGGNACAVCGAGLTCSGGTCKLNGGALYDFVAVGARVPALNGTGGAWDAFGGLPDPILEATSGATTKSTPVRQDTLVPAWNTVVLSGLTAGALLTNLKVEVTDSDVAFSDFMGGCNLTLTAADFDGALHTIACPKSATGLALSVDYRIKTH